MHLTSDNINVFSKCVVQMAWTTLTHREESELCIFYRSVVVYFYVFRSDVKYI